MIDPQLTTGMTCRSRSRRGRVLLAVAILTLAPAGVVRAQKAGPGAGDGPPPARSKGLGEQVADQLVQEFQAVWPNPPEWVAMLVDILQGRQLGPGDGWFKTAVGRTRYDWNATRQRLDRDGDGRIARAEFAGSDDDFGRLDRDRDGSLDARDFDFSPHALAPSPAALIFYAADRDGNGKLTREELDAFFRAADSGGAGFLSVADLQEALTPPPHGKGSSGGPQGPSRLTLVKGLFRQEIGSLQPG